jgi:hypothetical protein
MKRYFTLFFLSAFHLAFSQGPTLLDKSANPGETIVEFDYRTYDVIGSYYLFKDWQMGHIGLRSGVYIQDQWINYNSENDMLEVKLEDEVKVVPLTKIGHFILQGQNSDNRFFRPCRNYLIENQVPLTGMCEVVDSGYYGLLIKYFSDVKEATYVPELDMGKKEVEIVIKQEYFLSFGDHVNRLPKRKQSFVSLYEPYEAELGTFIKVHKLNHKKEEELRIILNYLNKRAGQLQ